MTEDEVIVLVRACAVGFLGGFTVRGLYNKARGLYNRLDSVPVPQGKLGKVVGVLLYVPLWLFWCLIVAVITTSIGVFSYLVFTLHGAVFLIAGLAGSWVANKVWPIEGAQSSTETLIAHRRCTRMVLLAEYANWAAEQVLSLAPDERVQEDWIPAWSRTLRAIQRAKGIFELLSIICARWEFLGSLYLGTIKDTSSKEAVEYVSRFLSPLNQNYRMIHNMSGQRTTSSEFFSMLRNQSLHGYTPAAISVHDGTKVIAWWIGSDERTQEYHLQIRNGLMHVDANKFLSEFLTSLDRFCIYLVQDQDIIDGRTPSDRWRRGFWARFKPKYMAKNTWMQEGYERGIPT